MRGSMNYPLYLARSFTYRNEQVKVDEVQRMIMHTSNCGLQGCDNV
jgi:hypothetical protein